MRKLLAVLAFALAACGGSTDKAGGSGKVPGSGADAVATCSTLVALRIGLLANCMRDNPALYAPTGGYGAGMWTICPLFEAEVTAGRIFYDASQGAACLAAYRAVTCADLPPGGVIAGPAIEPAACTAAFTGTVALGGTCFVADDCSNGFCSSEVSNACPGTCQPFQAEGASCITLPCGPGLQCQYENAGSKFLCRATGPEGAACPCEPGLWCNNDNAGGRCETGIVAGGACALYSTGCPVGHQCQGATNTTLGTCDPFGSPGSACEVSSQCGLGYQCVSGTCASLPTPGQDCSTTWCAEGYCDISRVCMPFLADGATCSDAPRGCRSGFCNPFTKMCEQSACGP
jgi:hypothetical protein